MTIDDLSLKQHTKTSPRIFFRCDASDQIGTGHILRCVTLATELSKYSYQIIFISSLPSPYMAELITKNGFRLAELPKLPFMQNFDSARATNSQSFQEFERTDIKQTLGWLSTNFKNESLYDDVLIVDHYLLGRTWQIKMRSLFRRIIVIDDLLDIPHEGTLIVDPNIRHKKDAIEYKSSLTKPDKFFSGKEYVFIRPTMKPFRKISREHKLKNSSILNVLVMFGGSDTKNYTGIAIEGLLKIEDINIHVILGLNNNNRDELQSSYEEYRNVKTHPPLDEPAQIMSICDLAIGSLGTITWERCYLGIPSLVLIDQPSHQGFTDYLIEEGIIVGIEYSPSSQAIHFSAERIISNLSSLKDHSAKLFDIIDGKGVNRIAGLIHEDRR